VASLALRHATRRVDYVAPRGKRRSTFFPICTKGLRPLDVPSAPGLLTSLRSPLGSLQRRFHPEGSGLGTFHMTLNRPLHFHCVPDFHVHLSMVKAFASRSPRHKPTTTLRCGAWPTIGRQNTRAVYEPFKSWFFGLPSFRSTRKHPLFADVFLSCVNAGPSNCWLPSCYLGPLPSLSSLGFDRVHRQAYDLVSYRIWID
jgi:hypothetical protein